MRIILLGVMLAAHLIATPVRAALVDINDLPLYVMEGVAPNVMLTFDNSGSMNWSFIPERMYTYKRSKRHIVFSSFNKIWYNRDYTYEPPLNYKGEPQPNSDFYNAKDNGYNVNSCRIDLSNDYRPHFFYTDRCRNDRFNAYWGGGIEPAFYYVFEGKANSNKLNNGLYRKVVVGPKSGPGGRDERTNFANWYSYYHNREFVAKAALSRAFFRLDDKFRVSHQALYNYRGIDSLSGLTVFDDQEKGRFYDWLYTIPVRNGGTPLLRATEIVTRRMMKEAPYRDDPKNPSSPQRACRQNFHILMTDGAWNDSRFYRGNEDGKDHVLGDNRFEINNYSPIAPYQDANRGFLADHTFAGWVTDLRKDLDDIVPLTIRDKTTDVNGDHIVDNYDIFWNPKNDPANWQHISTYTIGLGVNGQRHFPNDYGSLMRGNSEWNKNKIDDLWHAAINGRGEYFSATTAEELIDSIITVIDKIVDRSGSSAPLTFNTTNSRSRTVAYQAKFDSVTWAGHLLSLRVSDGKNCPGKGVGELCAVQWDAACALDGGHCEATDRNTQGLDPSRRSITISNGAVAVPFRWNNIDSGLQKMFQESAASIDKSAARRVSGKEVLDYLRGNHSYERRNGGVFRDRNSMLGDMILSNPVYTGPPRRAYEHATNLPEAASYLKFKADYARRHWLIFIGANDGMLHGFTAKYGKEVFAFIPGPVKKKLTKLIQPDYTHTNYVDGPLTEGDVFYDSRWHSMLVGGLGLGGQGVYALDVSSKALFSESNAGKVLLWEFTDANDPDLGYTFGKPYIIRMHNGRWGVVFGNGLNNSDPTDSHVSAKGGGFVYILDAETGKLVAKLGTGFDSTNDPSGKGRNNGVIGLTPVDINGDYITDYLYAADIFGNVFKYDITSKSADDWGSVFKVGARTIPFFTARDNHGQPQPITSSLVVKKHPRHEGVMLFFGTGIYLGISDLYNGQKQSFYGVWDSSYQKSGKWNDAVNGINRNHLVKQSVIATSQTQFNGKEARVTSKYSVDWESFYGWYIDLPETGERVVQSPLVRNDNVIFITTTPSDDPCRAGGESWLIELNAEDGSRPGYTPYDYNGVGGIDVNDLVKINRNIASDMMVNGENTAVGSGVRIENAGIYTTPATLTKSDNSGESRMFTTSKGDVRAITSNPTQSRYRSWIELR